MDMAWILIAVLMVLVAMVVLSYIVEKMWRWGTMGAISEADMIAALGAFEIAIRQMGYRFPEGAAVNAALDVFSRAGEKKLVGVS